MIFCDHSVYKYCMQYYVVEIVEQVENEKF